MARIRNNPSIAVSGVVIAPNWVLTAAHNGNNASLDTTYTINGVPYDADLIIESPFADLALVKIVASDGSTPNLDYIGIDPGRRLTPGSQITQGGYGFVARRDPITGDLTSGLTGRGTLRWGEEVLTVAGGSLAYQTDSNPGFEVIGRHGDSGGGYFFHDGWNWRLAATTIGVGNGTSLTTVLNYNWIVDTINNNDVIGFPSLPTASKPNATTAWTNASGDNNWHTAANWTNGLPQFDTSDADIVHIDNSDQAVISTVAAARTLFVQGTQRNGALAVNAGSDLTVGSLFLGPEAGEVGVVAMYGGKIAAEVEHAGYGGTGSFVHAGGINEVASLVVGNINTAGVDTTEYILIDLFGQAPSVNASAIVLGAGNQSEGKFTMSNAIPSNATVTSDTTTVGLRGIGQFSHEAGTHTTSSLSIGPLGTYQLSGGSLNATQNMLVEGLFETSGNGNANAADVTSTGTLRISSGNLTIGNLAITGVLDLDNGDGSVNVSGFADLTGSQLTANNAPNARIVTQAGGLIVATPHQISSFPSLFSESIGQPVHRLGDTLTIDQHIVTVSGDFGDPVVVTSTSSGTVGILRRSGGANNTATLSAGLQLLDGGIVGDDFEIPKVVVPSGRDGVGFASVINPTTGQYSIGSVEITPSGKLTASGASQTPMTIRNQGSLEIAGISTLEVEYYASSDIDQTDTFTPELVMDVSSSGHDQLNISGKLPVVGGKLQLDLDSADLAQLTIGDEFDLVSLTDASTSLLLQFDEVTYGEATQAELQNAGFFLAVLYDNQTFPSGIRYSDGVTARVTIPGDANLDNIVNGTDLTILGENWMKEGATWEDGDFNQDGIVNGTDQTILGGFWLTSFGGGTTPTPEPTSLSLVGTLALLTMARRQRIGRIAS